MNFSAKDISVLIPTYNRPSYLKECLESITIQTKLPLEVIIVDASESFDTKIIVDKFYNCRFNIQYFRTKPDKIEQRNYGISKSNGKLIQLSDDDIVFDPKYFENVEVYLKEIKDDKFGGFIGSIFEKKELVNDNPQIHLRKNISTLIQKMFSISPIGMGKLLKSGQYQLIRNKIIGFAPIHVEVMGGAGCYLIDALQFSKFDNFFSGYAGGEDLDFSLQTSIAFNLYYFPKAVYFHDHIGSSNLTKQEYWRDRIKLLRFFYRKYKKKYNLSVLNHSWALFGLMLFSMLNKIKFKIFIEILKTVDKTYDIKR